MKPTAPRKEKKKASTFVEFDGFVGSHAGNRRQEDQKEAKELLGLQRHLRAHEKSRVWKNAGGVQNGMKQSTHGAPIMNQKDVKPNDSCRPVRKPDAN